MTTTIILALFYLLLNLYILLKVSYKKLSKRMFINLHIFQIYFAITLIILYYNENNIFSIIMYFSCLIIHIYSLKYFIKFK